VHGNRGSSIYWEQVIDLFHSRRDVRTVSLDLRGYGKSNHITELNSMEDFADDVHGVAMKVAKDAGMAEEEISARFVVVGWSFGGMVVITLASKYPAYYSRLVLVASGPIGGMKIGREVTK
jgi:pimeloyl-ACP methyl ester carboxylesterase